MKTALSLYGVVLLLLHGSLSLPAQVMSTFAGNGQSGYSGNGGLATAASLADALGVCSDPSGNIYIADHANHVVRVVDKFNTIKAFAGNGTQGYGGDGGAASNAKMDYPYGLYADKSGNVYISDRARNVIRKVSTAGIITTVAGTGTPGYSGDGGNAMLARLSGPMGITGDEEGNIYWVEFNNLVVRKMDKNGIISTFAGNNTRGYSGDGGSATDAQLNSPVGICADKAGNIYIADTDNLVVRKVNKSGNITTVAGNHTRGYSGDGGPATAAQLSSPYAVFSDTTGILYIGDTRNHVVRRIDENGIITTFAGTGQRGNAGDGESPALATFSAPASICMDADGNMYIADPENYVIRKAGICKTATIDVQPKNVSSCINATVTLFTNATDGAARYTWQVNTGNEWIDIADETLYNGAATQFLEIKNTTASMNGYQYRCIAINGCGQTSTLPATLTIVNPNAVSTLTIESLAEGCAGELIHFKARLIHSTGATTYQWHLNGNPLSGENDSTFASSTLHDADRVLCTATTDASCILNPLTVSNEIIVKINPPITASISIQASETAICAQTPVSFAATTHNAGSNPRFIWQKNGVATGQNSPAYTDPDLHHQDMITCALVSSQLCADTAFSNTISISVYALPVVTFDSSELFLSPGSNTLLQPATSGNIVQYTWTPATGLSNSSNANPVVNTTQDMIYTLQVKTDKGCHAAASVAVKLYKPLWMPTAFTPNNDGKNDIFRIAPDIPLTLKHFSIYNRWGKMVFETNKKNEGWDGGNCQAGVYIWVITYVDALTGKTISKKGSVLLMK